MRRLSPEYEASAAVAGSAQPICPDHPTEGAACQRREGVAWAFDALETPDCDRVTKGGAFGSHPVDARPESEGQTRATHRPARGGFGVLKE